MNYKNIFSARLSTLRRDKKLSLEATGKIVGVSNQAISSLEKGKSAPSFDVLCALADYFDVSLDYLVGRSDDPTRH